MATTSDFLNTSQAPTFGYAFTQVFDENTAKPLNILNTQSTNITTKINANVEILAEQIGSTTARVFHGKINQNPNSLKTISMKSFETFSGMELSRVEVSGKLKDVIDGIIKKSNINFKTAGSRQQAKDVKNNVRVNLYKGLMESFNSNVDVKKLQDMKTKVHLVSLVDFEKLSKIDGKMNPTQINDVFAGGVMRSPEGFPQKTGQIEKTDKLKPIQQQINQQKPDTFKRLKVGANFGVFSFVLQSIALMQAGHDAADKGILSQAGVTFIGLIVSALGGVADVLDRQLKTRIALLGKTVKLDFAQRFVHGTAVFSLYAGALILASVEWYKAYDAWEKDQTVVARLYVLNGFLIIASTHAFVRGAAMVRLGLSGTYWGIILVAVIWLIGYGIDSAKRSALRDLLQNSAWGTKPDGWTKEIEAQKFKDVYDEDE